MNLEQICRARRGIAPKNRCRARRGLPPLNRRRSKLPLIICTLTVWAMLTWVAVILFAS